MSDVVNARWVAAYVAELGRTLLVPGETVVKIPRGEAEASDNWEVLEDRIKRRDTAPSEPSEAAA